MIALFCVLLYCNPLLLLKLVPLLGPASKNNHLELSWGKRPGREADHTTSLSAEVNAWSSTATASYVLIDCCLKIIVKKIIYIYIYYHHLLLLLLLHPSSFTCSPSCCCCCCKIYTDNILVSLHHEVLSSCVLPNTIYTRQHTRNTNSVIVY